MDLQASKLDVVESEQSKRDKLHKGHVERMRIRHNSDISELKKIH